MINNLQPRPYGGWNIEKVSIAQSRLKFGIRERYRALDYFIIWHCLRIFEAVFVFFLANSTRHRNNSATFVSTRICLLMFMRIKAPDLLPVLLADWILVPRPKNCLSLDTPFSRDFFVFLSPGSHMSFLLLFLFRLLFLLLLSFKLRRMLNLIRTSRSNISKGIPSQ